MRTRQTSGKMYDCSLTKKQVLVQLRENAQPVGDESPVCSNIGGCGCDVVEIIYGMSYTVNWKKCCLYSTIKQADQSH